VRARGRIRGAQAGVRCDVAPRAPRPGRARGGAGTRRIKSRFRGFPLPTVSPCRLCTQSAFANASGNPVLKQPHRMHPHLSVHAVSATILGSQVPFIACAGVERVTWPPPKHHRRASEKQALGAARTGGVEPHATRGRACERTGPLYSSNRTRTMGAGPSGPPYPPSGYSMCVMVPRVLLARCALVLRLWVSFTIMPTAR